MKISLKNYLSNLEFKWNKFQRKHLSFIDRPPFSILAFILKFIIYISIAGVGIALLILFVSVGLMLFLGFSKNIEMSTTILVLIISLIEILNNLYKDLNKIEKSYETLIDKWILKYVEIGKYVLVILLIIHYSTKYYYKLVEFTEWLSQLA